MRSGFPSKTKHGGLIKRHLEKTGLHAIDFSASLNPFPPDMEWNFDPQLLDHYPDDDYTLLKEIIGRHFNRDADEIAVGNGSIELIRTFCQVIFRNGGGASIDPHTFGEYLLSVQLAGGHKICANELPLVSFLCNPNNPTGQLMPKAIVSEILQKVSSENCFLFLDEAFIELSDPKESHVDSRDPHLFVLRSLTKCFSVPGLRFGYAFGEPDLISSLEVARPPWSVNSFAEQFAIQAFSKFDLLEESREKIKDESVFLENALKALGLSVRPPSANFILVDTGMNAATLCSSLARYGLLVRDCASFGLPESIRISVRTHEENQQLVEALPSCLP